MERYAEYKETEIEWIADIPSDWKIVPAKAIWSLRKELCTEEASPDDLLAVSEYYGVAPRKMKIASDETLMRAESLSGYQLCHPGDLVMNIMLAWKGAQGVSNYDGVVSPSYAVYKPIDLTNRNQRYFHYLLRSDLYKTAFKRWSTGIIESRLRLYPDVFMRIPILLPPHRAQSAIADYLDEKNTEIDFLIEQTERSIEHLEEYRKSIISEAVTKGLDPNAPMKDSKIEWIGEMPKHWCILKIKEIASLVTGRTPPSNATEYYDGDVDWYTPGDLGNDELTNSQRTLSKKAIEDSMAPLHPGYSTLLVGIGATAGKVGFSQYACSSNQQLTSIHSNSINNKYIFYWLMAHETIVKSLALYTTLPIISNDFLGSFPIIIPAQEEQKAIICHLDRKTKSISAQIKLKLQLKNRLQEYRKSLISEAVTGKFKVPGVE